MKPTAEKTSATPDKKPPSRPERKKSDLMVKVKYGNKLPDIPSDLKCIPYPLNLARFIQYKPTSLERSYKFEHHTDCDLDVKVDLIDNEKYTSDKNETLDKADEELLEEEIFVQNDSKRSKNHARSVSWLRRTEYISTEHTRFQPQTIEKVEAKVGFSINKDFKKETLHMDRDSQMKAIEKTFEDNKKPIKKHYSKPNVHAVEVLDVFPDFKNWKYPCAQVIFDSDPAPKDRPVQAEIEEMSQAMIRGVEDESGAQFVAYFLPSDKTVTKRREDAVENRPYDIDFAYDYKMTREYNWNVKSKNCKGYEENYFLIERPEGVFYNELETRVRLSKRQKKKGEQSSNTNTKLIVQHVPISEREHIIHKMRENHLKSYDEEEEAIGKAITASVENVKEIAIKIKTDSDIDDSIKKDEFKKDAAGAGSDVFDEDDDRKIAVTSERRQSETVNGSDNNKTLTHDDSVNNDSEKEIDENSQRSSSVAKSYSDSSVQNSSNHKTNHRTLRNASSESKNKSDGKVKKNGKESSLIGIKDKRVRRDAVVLDKGNNDVEMRSKKSLERAANVAYFEFPKSPTISDYSGSISKRDSGSE